MKILWVLLPVIFIAGCNSFPRVDFTWPKHEKDAQIEQLQTDLENAEKKTEEALAEKAAEIVAEETSRISKGTSQVYAAHGTLNADPEPNKYVDASLGALIVAKEALPLPTIEDLLAADKIQKKLLSEQAAIIQEGKKELAEQSNTIIQSKLAVDALEKEKNEIITESKKTQEALEGQLIVAELAREKDRKEHLSEIKSKAAEYDKENNFWARINPLNGLARTFSSLMFWVVLIVVFGIILKLSSILFPGVNIIQTLVKGLGRVIGSVIGMFTRWIPSALRGMDAVDYNEFKKEKDIANNAVGAIQELKYENPEVYKEQLRAKLLDWFKDTPGLEEVVEKKLKELNLK